MFKKGNCNIWSSEIDIFFSILFYSASPSRHFWFQKARQLIHSSQRYIDVVHANNTKVQKSLTRRRFFQPNYHIDCTHGSHYEMYFPPQPSSAMYPLLNIYASKVFNNVMKSTFETPCIEMTGWWGCSICLDILRALNILSCGSPCEKLYHCQQLPQEECNKSHWYTALLQKMLCSCILKIAFKSWSGEMLSGKLVP